MANDRKTMTLRGGSEKEPQGDEGTAQASGPLEVRVSIDAKDVKQAADDAFAAIVTPLRDHIAVDLAAARAEADHIKASTLETLHLYAGEFLVKVREIEGSLSGDVHAAVQRIKALL